MKSIHLESYSDDNTDQAIFLVSAPGKVSYAHPERNSRRECKGIYKKSGVNSYAESRDNPEFQHKERFTVNPVYSEFAEHQSNKRERASLPERSGAFETRKVVS